MATRRRQNLVDTCIPVNNNPNKYSLKKNKSYGLFDRIQEWWISPNMIRTRKFIKQYKVIPIVLMVPILLACLHYSITYVRIWRQGEPYGWSRCQYTWIKDMEVLPQVHPEGTLPPPNIYETQTCYLQRYPNVTCITPIMYGQPYRIVSFVGAASEQNAIRHLTDVHILSKSHQTVKAWVKTSLYPDRPPQSKIFPVSITIKALDEDRIERKFILYNKEASCVSQAIELWSGV